jgi:hypothetical protein
MIATRQSGRKPMEHRFGERVLLEVPVGLSLQDGTSLEGRILNASISGALIETGARLSIDSTLGIVMSTGQGTQRRAIELPACVVRIAPGCIGVEWRDMGVPTLVELLNQAYASDTGFCRRQRAFG